MKKEVGPREYFGATLTKVTERSGKNGPYLMWEFTDENGERRVGFTDSDIILGNRTWSWLYMLGISLHIGDVLELQELQGIECFIFIDDRGTVRMVANTLDQETKQADTETPKQPEPPVNTGTSEAAGLFS